MTSRELFEAGQLSDAIEEQSKVVEYHPTDASARLLYCELLAFAGRFNAVLEQLSLFQTDDPAFHEYLNGWRELVEADIARHAGKEAMTLFDPPAYLQTLENDGDEEELEESFALAPTMEGFIDGRAFEECRDCDDELMFGFEFFTEGSYLFILWEHAKKIRLETVDCLRDQLYRPATVTLVDQRVIEGFLPVHYVMSEQTEESLLCGHGTDFDEADDLMKGVGAKLWLIGEEEVNLLEFTQLELRISH